MGAVTPPGDAGRAAGRHLQGGNPADPSPARSPCLPPAPIPAPEHASLWEKHIFAGEHPFVSEGESPEPLRGSAWKAWGGTETSPALGRAGEEV